MKLIHTADVHLGSRMDSKFPREIAEKRKIEVRQTFNRIIEYAKQNGISVIMLSGDVFESDAPFKKDKDFFYGAVKDNPDIDFLYLRGNHDCGGTATDLPENLKTFSEQWTSYTYGDTVISGIEMSLSNAVSMYSSLSLDKTKKNIVMLHGQTGSEWGKDKINLGALRNKNIDYLALGHIHKPSSGKLDERGVYVYPGCPEGRGFDEIGPRGFEVVEVGKTVSHSFIPFSLREIREENVDITGAKNGYEISRIVRENVKFEKKNIYRINLIGELDFGVASWTADVAGYLSDECLFVEVKDRTKKKLNTQAFLNDISVKGEFVRKVTESALSDEEKSAIILYGLNALNGDEIE